MSKMEDLFRGRGVLYALVCSREGERLFEFGDARSLPYRGLLERFFLGAGSFQLLFDYLDNSILPQVVSQGELSCVLTVLPSGVVVGAFVMEGPGVGDIHAWAEDLEMELQEADAEGGWRS